MKSEIEEKIYEIRGKAIETEGIINELTENVLDYTITQKPLTDIIETNEALIIRTDLPGLNKDDLKVDIGEERVYIKAKFPEENKATDVNYIQKERNHGTILKSIPLPSNIRPEKATGYFNNSILTVRIPKNHKKHYNPEIKDL